MTAILPWWLGLGGCTAEPEAGGPPPGPTDGATSSVMTPVSSLWLPPIRSAGSVGPAPLVLHQGVSAHLVGLSLGKPPLKALRLDWRITNTAPQPRWLITERDFAIGPRPAAPTDARAVWIHAVDGAACSIVEIRGRPDRFLAIPVAPGATAEIRSVSMRTMDDLDPHRFSPTAKLADRITVAGADIGSVADLVPCADGASGRMRHHGRSVLDNDAAQTVPVGIEVAVEVDVAISTAPVLGPGW